MDLGLGLSFRGSERRGWWGGYVVFRKMHCIHGLASSGMRVARLSRKLRTKGGCAGRSTGVGEKA